MKSVLDFFRRPKKEVMGRMRTIAFLNQSKSTEITTKLLAKIGEAIYLQVVEDYAPFWESGAPERIIACASMADVPKDAAILAFIDTPDEAEALGYHYVLPNGQPIGRVFWEPIRDNDGTLYDGANSLSQTASHEVLEMLGDPYCNWWADCGADEEDAIELCDRVEGDSYDRHGVAVSNFLGPRAFRAGEGPYDFMGRLTTPFGLTEGGYAIRRSGGPSGKTRQIFAHGYPEWKVALKGAKKFSRGSLRAAR